MLETCMYTFIPCGQDSRCDPAPYDDRAWDMGSYTEYMWVYDGICQVVRIPDADSESGRSLGRTLLRLRLVLMMPPPSR